MTYRFGWNWVEAETMGIFAQCGFSYVETVVDIAFVPSQGEAAWALQKAQFREIEERFSLKPEVANGFLPGRLHICGGHPDTEELLDYGETACRRADEVGTQFIVFGSGGARQIPEGFDHARGMEQFVDFCRELVRRIADCNVVVLLENLQAKECNVVNLLAQEQEIVEAVDSPRLQMMADFYHMAAMEESPEAIVKAGRHLKHVHIADPNTRRWPGETDGDLSRYFQALRQIGYQGRISFECGWPKIKEVGSEAAKKTILESMGRVKQWLAD